MKRARRLLYFERLRRNQDGTATAEAQRRASLVRRRVENHQTSSFPQCFEHATPILFLRLIHRQSELGAEFARALGERSPMARNPDDAFELRGRLAREQARLLRTCGLSSGAICEPDIQLLQFLRPFEPDGLARLTTLLPDPALHPARGIGIVVVEKRTAA